MYQIVIFIILFTLFWFIFVAYAGMDDVDDYYDMFYEMLTNIFTDYIFLW
jgi:hypothetical protein